MDYVKSYIYNEETKVIPFKLCSKLNIDCYKKHSISSLSDSIHTYARNQNLYVDDDTSLVMDDLLKDQLNISETNLKVAVPYFNNNLLNRLWSTLP